MLLVLDAHYLLHRCSFVKELAALTTSWGCHAGAALGVIRSVHDLLDRFPACDRAVLVFDGGISTRRRALFPGYKVRTIDDPAEHQRAAAEFRENREILKALAAALRVRTVEIKGREGDDVIAVVCRQVQAAGRSAIIVSDDKDMYQLVCRDVWVYRPIAEQLVRLENFTEITKGVRWGRWLLFRATTGDASDKIPGIEDVGETTARNAVEGVDAEKGLVGVYRLFCSTSSNRRIKKIADCFDVVERNLNLMDLGRESFSDAERERIQAALEEPVLDPEAAVGAALAVCDGYEYRLLAEQLPGWIIPFQRLR